MSFFVIFLPGEEILLAEIFISPPFTNILQNIFPCLYNWWIFFLRNRIDDRHNLIIKICTDGHTICTKVWAFTWRNRHSVYSLLYICKLRTDQHQVVWCFCGCRIWVDLQPLQYWWFSGLRRIYVCWYI